MAIFIQDGTGSAVSVSANDNIIVTKISVTAASGADAVLTIADANSSKSFVLAAKAGTSANDGNTTGGNQFRGFNFIAPVTLTLTGTGAWARIDF